MNLDVRISNTKYVQWGAMRAMGWGGFPDPVPCSNNIKTTDQHIAHGTIPVLRAAQGPGPIFCLQADDRFAVNVCSHVGLTLAGGVYKRLADMAAELILGARDTKTPCTFAHITIPRLDQE